MCLATTNNNGSMAEWSNATDLSSVSFGSAGSNPAGTIIGYHTATTMNFELSSAALCFVGSNPATPTKGVYPSGQRRFFNTMVSDNNNNNTVPLAQSVEHETFNLRAAGSSPAEGFSMDTCSNTFFSLQTFNLICVKNCIQTTNTLAPIAQMVRASFLYSECRGFEPLWEYFKISNSNIS